MLLEGFMYLALIYSHARGVTIYDSGLCCCVCFKYFKYQLTPLCVDFGGMIYVPQSHIALPPVSDLSWQGRRLCIVDFHFAGSIISVWWEGEHIQVQVWRKPGDVGVQRMDTQAGSIWMVPVVLQVRPTVLASVCLWLCSLISLSLLKMIGFPSRMILAFLLEWPKHTLFFIPESKIHFENMFPALALLWWL